MIDPEVETAAVGQRGTARTTRSIAARSPICSSDSRFYRDRLTAAGFPTPEVGRRARRRSPTCRSPRRTRSARPATTPIRSATISACPCPKRCASSRPAAPPGVPSYIPLTANDLQAWTRISARSYSASGLRRRRGPDLDLWRRSLRRRRHLRRLQRPRRLSHPDRLRQHRAADDHAAAAQAVDHRADPVLRPAPRRMGAGPRHRSGRHQRHPAAGRRRARRRRAGHARPARGRSGARRSPRSWGSATSPPRSGANAPSSRACISAAAASSISS